VGPPGKGKEGGEKRGKKEGREGRGGEGVLAPGMPKSRVGKPSLLS